MLVLRFLERQNRKIFIASHNYELKELDKIDKNKKWKSAGNVNTRIIMIVVQLDNNKSVNNGNLIIEIRIMKQKKCRVIR